MVKKLSPKLNSILAEGAGLFLLGIIKFALMFPYSFRVRLSARLFRHVVFPLAGYRKRIVANLKYVCPELSATEIRAILREVPDNFGRTLIEEYSGHAFIDRVMRARVTGGGYGAIQRAHQNNQPVVLVTGHFGNYDAARGILIAKGFRMGCLYRPFNNARFDRHYRAALEIIGKPIFPRNRRGEREMLRFLKSGGMIGLLADQHMNHGAQLSFFGKPAASALSAAKMALKNNALLVPIYATRQPNGLDFEVAFEDPIPHTTAEVMTQAVNDSLERRVRGNMGQWLWVHRRWKPGRQGAQRKRAAAST